MSDFERDRFIEDLEGLKERFLLAHTKSQILESAIKSSDDWATPEEEYSEERYDYVPISVGDFTEWLIELDGYLKNDPDFRHDQQKYRPFSFIEIGCGIGRNVNIVRSQELLPAAKVVGFDLCESYIEAARALHGLGENVFVGDCMTFDYGGFDVLYFYRPFRDVEAEIKFEKHLIASIKRGSILIAAAAEILEDSRELMPIGDSGRLFKKL